jgi:hypothetical protein
MVMMAKELMVMMMALVMVIIDRKHLDKYVGYVNVSIQAFTHLEHSISQSIHLSRVFY